MKAIYGFVACLVACAGEPVGRLCDLGAIPADNEIVVASGSLDCVSRTCLRMPLTQALPAGAEFPTGATGLCTAECNSDDDCEGSPDSPCTGGFACAVAVDVGPFCCKKFCMCRDYGVPPQPLACDPSQATNHCSNLPDRP
jgi:hypothetical protein